MNIVWSWLRRPALWPLWVLVAGMLVILPRLGTYGFWEPQEIKVADEARERLEQYTLDEITQAVAHQYNVAIGELKNARTAPQQNAREVVIYLAGLYTREDVSDLAQTFSMTTAQVEEADDHVTELLATDGSEMSRNISEIEKYLASDQRPAGRRKATAKATSGPPLTEWLVAEGIDHISGNELGARLPLALLALATLLATFYLGRRLGGPRAGLIAGLVLLSCPLFLLQARQLTSDLGAIAGSTFIMLGLVGLGWPAGGRAKRPLWLYPVDLALVVVGAVLSYYAAAALLGLVAPLAAAGLACATALIADRKEKPEPGDPIEPHGWWRRGHLLAIAIAASIATIVVLVVVITGVFDFTDPIPGSRALFGKSMVPATGYVPVLGGSWRPNGDLNATFDALFQQIAFGFYPWAALAPIAVIDLALGPRRGRRAWAGYTLFGWALVAWVVATVMFRKVGPVHYPALVALAVAVGMWLDDLLTAREAADRDPSGIDDVAARARYGMPLRLPLVGLFVVAAVVVMAKDMHVFPDKITSLHVLTSTVEYPKGMAMKDVFLVSAALFSLTLGVGIWLWWGRAAHPTNPIRRVGYFLGRHGIQAGVGVALVFAVFLAQVWTPALSRKLSSKYLFSVYHRYKHKGDKLGVMGSHGSGPKYYAGDQYTKLANRRQLLEFLEEPERVFALVPASELCAVHRSAKDKFNYYVLDDSHARFLLLSNKLESGETDRNPLARSILRHPPTDIQTPMKVNFDNKIELIGVNMPRRVSRGSSFTMTLFFKVLKPVGGNWKIFVHFDGGGLRFQGDHSPINGRCGTNFWQPGDYIVDRFTVEAGDLTYAKTAYTARVGFFVGSHGNWKNMKVVEGEHGDDDRVPVGVLQVR